MYNKNQALKIGQLTGRIRIEFGILMNGIRALRFIGFCPFPNIKYDWGCEEARRGTIPNDPKPFPNDWCAVK